MNNGFLILFQALQRFWQPGRILADTQDSAQPNLEIFNPSKENLDAVNPLQQFSSKADQLSTPGGIISELLRFALPAAGIILFLMLLFGGFQMLTGAGDSKSLEEGKKRITAAILGFFLLFAAYWIAQLVELIFGITILG